uniref:Uncharacterized protein n=1 Tax=viral metagenome TaxID=1070528 RepID=A0A6C0CRB2_9ZZZZ
MLKQLLIGLLFALGLYYVTYGRKCIEGFSDEKQKYRCPNVLIQKGNEFYLYNSNLANVPGVNPIKFNSLEEYTEFMDWQRSQGIRCPILFLQESYDAQGNPTYNARPSPDNLMGGLPQGEQPVTKLLDAGRDDMPYNKNSYPAYDPQDQYVGLNTPLDRMYNDKSSVSPNPMDANWGGQAYTQELVDEGYYAGDEVQIRVAD